MTHKYTHVLTQSRLYTCQHTFALHNWAPYTITDECVVSVNESISGKTVWYVLCMLVYDLLLNVDQQSKWKKNSNGSERQQQQQWQWLWTKTKKSRESHIASLKGATNRTTATKTTTTTTVVIHNSCPRRQRLSREKNKQNSNKNKSRTLTLIKTESTIKAGEPSKELCQSNETWSCDTWLTRQFHSSRKF